MSLWYSVPRHVGSPLCRTVGQRCRHEDAGSRATFVREEGLAVGAGVRRRGVVFSHPLFGIFVRFGLHGSSTTVLLILQTILSR